MKRQRQERQEKTCAEVDIWGDVDLQFLTIKLHGYVKGLLKEAIPLSTHCMAWRVNPSTCLGIFWN